MKTLLHLTQEENGTIHVSSDVYPIQTSFMSIPEPVNEHPELAQSLKEWRRAKAREMEGAAYIILNNQTLLELSNLCPTTPEEMQFIKGMGPTRMEKYGQDILNIIGQYLEFHPKADPDTGELSID